MDVKLGEWRFFDFVTVNPSTGLPADVFSVVYDVHLGGTSSAMAYHPTSVDRDDVGHLAAFVEITTANGFVVGTNYAVSATVTFTDGGQEYEIPLGNFMVREYSVDDLPSAIANALAGAAVHVTSPMAPGGRAVLLEKATYSSATGQRLPFPLRATDPDAAGADTCVMHILSNTDDSILVTLTGPITGSVGSQTGYISVTTATDLALLTKGEDYRYRTYAKYGSALSPIALNTIQRKD
jgi:hypothetical protein